MGQRKAVSMAVVARRRRVLALLLLSAIGAAMRRRADRLLVQSITKRHPMPEGVQGGCHMRIAVMAAGAVGGYFGGRMAAAGHDVVFIARGAHRDAIHRDGLKIESALGAFTSRMLT